MINIEAFSKRLKLILNHYDISATLLAEKIEVQRSSISHILSGRNKPSLDFVLKILKSFPEVELYWLLNGVGEFPTNSKKVTSTPTLPSSNKQDNTINEIKKPNSNNEKNSDIERIVVFYKDGTFKNYIP